MQESHRNSCIEWIRSKQPNSPMSTHTDNTTIAQYDPPSHFFPWVAGRLTRVVATAAAAPEDAMRAHKREVAPSLQSSCGEHTI